MLRTQAERRNDEIAAWFEKGDINNESDSLLMQKSNALVQTMWNLTSLTIVTIGTDDGAKAP